MSSRKIGPAAFVFATAMFAIPCLFGAAIAALTGVTEPWVGACTIGPIGITFISYLCQE